MHGSAAGALEQVIYARYHKQFVAMLFKMQQTLVGDCSKDFAPIPLIFLSSSMFLKRLPPLLKAAISADFCCRALKCRREDKGLLC